MLDTHWLLRINYVYTHPHMNYREVTDPHNPNIQQYDPPHAKKRKKEPPLQLSPDLL